MDAATIATAMGCSRAVADRYVVDMNTAMLAASCTTVNRAAMWCAQVGHESAGLKYMEELASGAAYEGRRDLGNTQPGDGKRFKGRGPIQLTGREGYTQFLAWCRGRGLNPPDFLRDPAQVATSRWGFLAASHYWTVRRPRINGYCDQADLFSVSCEINGWIRLKDGSWRTPNGYADRRDRWDRCRALGTRILPIGGATPPPAKPPPPPPPTHHLQGDDDMPLIRTAAPKDGQEKWDWPTTRESLSFRPGSGVVKLDHGGRGGWVHAIIWWVRDPNWDANVPLHFSQLHPVGASRGHAGSERFVGYGWESAPPNGADFVEIVFSAPDGANLQFWRTS